MERNVFDRPLGQLRVALATNAATSGLGGLLALVATGWVDDSLGTEQPGWLRAVGAGLVLFAFAVMAISRTGAAVLRHAVPAVSVADALWVVVSAATIAAGWYSPRGAFIIGVLAVVVGVLALTQMRLWRSSSASPGT